MTGFGNWGGVPRYLSAQEAAARLGVSRRTLYVYVSRRLVRSIGAQNKKRYLESDISQLLIRKKAARRPSMAAHDALDWGLPVLDSAITLIDKGRIWYRGVDATWLADNATIEDTARLLWGCQQFQPFAMLDARSSRKIALTSPAHAMARMGELLATAAAMPSSSEPPELWVEAAYLLRHLYAAAAGLAVSKRPLDRVLAAGFGRLQASDVFRRAVILSADHELSTSAFSVRCAASTGAPLAAALLAGLGAFYGPAQGGAPEEVEKLVDECMKTGSVKKAIAQRLRTGQPFPGFGHKLHPLGDCRGSSLLERLSQTPETRAVASEMLEVVGLKPNIAFALVALRRSLGLPRGAALTIYTCGRALGWAAHAIEQRLSGELIRPRARYTGLPPIPPLRPIGGVVRRSPN